MKETKDFWKLKKWFLILLLVGCSLLIDLFQTLHWKEMWKPIIRESDPIFLVNTSIDLKIAGLEMQMPNLPTDKTENPSKRREIQEHNIEMKTNIEDQKKNNTTNVTQEIQQPDTLLIHWKEDNSTNATLDKTSQAFQEVIPTKPLCDFSDPRSNICDITGDVRIEGKNFTIFLAPPKNSLWSNEQAWNVSPQSRKIIVTKNVTVKHSHGLQNAPNCTVKNNIPAIVFSLGGLTANIWHDFSDVIIPLFLASKPFNGEIQFIIRDMRQWFLDKYMLIFQDLSRYELINFDKDKEVRCYPHAQVGLLNHRDFGINPDRAFDRFDLFKFRMYIRSIYSLPLSIDLPYKLDPMPDKKPRLMLVLRAGIRRFLNEPDVVDIVKKKGFELVLVEPQKNVNITEFSKLVDSCDVLMGVHGAALTNILFLRTNALLIQIIPYGHIDNFALWYYGRQAQEMQIREIHYTIIPEESSLLEKYGWEHPVIKDPDAVNARGFADRMKYYWYEQDVRLNVTRFEPVLVKALQLLNE